VAGKEERDVTVQGAMGCKVYLDLRDQTAAMGTGENIKWSRYLPRSSRADDERERTRSSAGREAE